MPTRLGIAMVCGSCRGAAGKRACRGIRVGLAGKHDPKGRTCFVMAPFMSLDTRLLLNCLLHQVPC
eukprot:350467-Chlamydomonas_euryale.AAC.1